MSFQFKVTFQSKKSRARVGQIFTDHGIIDTPQFVAVGTNGALKAVDSKMAESIGLQLIFCNTYHLMVQPGTKLIQAAGGLHRFMNRNLPIITDSGGFQVFSLKYGGVAQELKSRGGKVHNNSVLKINEEGVSFRSYRDGSLIHLTPETSIQAQKELGADIMVAFDELPPYHIDHKKLLSAFERTHRWEKRSLNYHLDHPSKQALYAVVHGGTDFELRARSIKYLSSLAFDGFAIGGSVGKNSSEMVTMLERLMPLVPYERPNHLLGIADLSSLKACIPLGIDTFDSAHPTKCARHGLLFTSLGPRRILKSEAATDFGPIDPNCQCLICKNYSASYLHHLFKAHELLAYQFASVHNLYFMARLMESYRESILNGDI
jgi:queuine tRNA-ribosyltransferase